MVRTWASCTSYVPRPDATCRSTGITRELTLVLRGAYQDETGQFRVGDAADLDESIEHRPVADPEAGCICVLAFERPARFKGLLPRLLQPLTGL